MEKVKLINFFNFIRDDPHKVWIWKDLQRSQHFIHRLGYRVVSFGPFSQRVISVEQRLQYLPSVGLVVNANETTAASSACVPKEIKAGKVTGRIDVAGTLIEYIDEKTVKISCKHSHINFLIYLIINVFLC